MGWWLLGATAVGVGGWGVVSTWWTLHPAPKLIAPPQPVPSFRTFTLTCHDRSSFELLVCDAASPRGVVIICHGYHANRLQVVPLAQGLSQRGYAALVFDLRGHGTRQQLSCTFGKEEVQDLGAILDWIARQAQWAGLPVGLVGWSFGGVVACQAAARDPRIRALVMDSSYPRLLPTLARVVKRDYHLPAPWAWVTWVTTQLALGRALWRVDPLALAPTMKIPLLLIHGDADQSVLRDEVTQLAARWQGPTATWCESSIAHVGMFSQHPTAYADRVTNFFDRWLSAAPR